jgi:transposase InsO family protein
VRGAWGNPRPYRDRENGFIESFNARLRDELLDGEILYSLKEVRVVVESWRRHYNTKRPHGSLGYKPRSRRGSGWNWVGVVSGLLNRNDSSVGALDWRPRHDKGYHECGG